MKRRRQFVLLGIVLLTMSVLWVVFRPKLVPVQTVSIERGPLQETVDEEGKTRMHDHFVVAATVQGQLRRVDLHAGDRVKVGQTLGWIDPAPIDPRQEAVLEAQLNSARAATQQADALAARAKVDSAQAEQDVARGRELYKHGIISKETLDKQTTTHLAMQQQLHAAVSGAESAAFEVEKAKAALLMYQDGTSSLPTPMLSPVDGRVLRVMEQSERVVVPGTPILEIGYMPRLEVVADFLTRDAVRIKPGMPAEIIDWGGDKPLPARVRLTEPGGFTKVSALGVEEQRVNVICDFAESADDLEDGYHVEVRVILWEGQSVLRVPSSAVFRSSGNWAVFVVQSGRAVQRIVRVGHHGETDWEVLDGLGPGDHVIVHPSSEVDNGVRVQET
ncbi:MAG: efflux RND transporter periplasmic adaptor subunit [Acidobacteriota bacterium]|nr:efflux RND transporter periplasmic adaptor subunit [Acidobacteriota bacterium]